MPKFKHDRNDDQFLGHFFGHDVYLGGRVMLARDGDHIADCATYPLRVLRASILADEGYIFSEARTGHLRAMILGLVMKATDPNALVPGDTIKINTDTVSDRDGFDDRVQPGTTGIVVAIGNGMVQVEIMLDNREQVVGVRMQHVSRVKQPTERGKANYPPDGLYEGIPCTCEPDCPYSCKGACGCDACRAGYSDFLDLE